MPSTNEYKREKYYASRRGKATADEAAENAPIEAMSAAAAFADIADAVGVPLGPLQVALGDVMADGTTTRDEKVAEIARHLSGAAGKKAQLQAEALRAMVERKIALLYPSEEDLAEADRILASYSHIKWDIEGMDPRAKVRLATEFDYFAKTFPEGVEDLHLVAMRQPRSIRMALERVRQLKGADWESLPPRTREALQALGISQNTVSMAASGGSLRQRLFQGLLRFQTKCIVAQNNLAGNAIYLNPTYFSDFEKLWRVTQTSRASNTLTSGSPAVGGTITHELGHALVYKIARERVRRPDGTYSQKAFREEARRISDWAEENIIPHGSTQFSKYSAVKNPMLGACEAIPETLVHMLYGAKKAYDLHGAADPGVEGYFEHPSLNCEAHLRDFLKESLGREKIPLPKRNWNNIYVT